MKLVSDRILVESAYILCNLDNVHPLHRYHRLPKDIRRDPKLQLSYAIAIANQHGNFIRACRLIDKLCPITFCAAFSSLPNIQRDALKVLSHAYHNKRITVPTRVVSKWLRFSDLKEAEKVCTHYGLKVEGDAVMFDKTAFNDSADLHILATKDLKTKFNMKSIIDIYTYTTKE